MKIVFTPTSLRQWKKLPQEIRLRIGRKLHFYIRQQDLLRFAKPVQDTRAGEYRFRIGEYRVVFDLKEDLIVIHAVGHRKNIYK